MRIGTVEVPASRPFQVGLLVTVSIVVLAGIAAQVPFVGLVVFLFGWAIGLFAGAVGGGYAARSGGTEQAADGAKIGAVVGTVGNAVGAVVAIAVGAAALVLGLTDVGPPSDAPPGAGPEIPEIPGVTRGDLLVGLVILGAVGFVTGTIMAAIGGAIGGAIATRL